MNTVESDMIGRVLRATTSKYTCGTHSLKVGTRHDFGAFVKAPVANHDTCCVIGLIYAVEIKDDQLISELVMADGLDANVLRDQRENRLVPVEVDVLSVGFGFLDERGVVNSTVHSLPPRPPMSLSEVRPCSAEEVYYFTQSCDFFRLVLMASDVPSDDLMAAALRYAAWAYPEEQRYEFMVRCGRHLTRLLNNDLKRLAHLLMLIRP